MRTLLTRTMIIKQSFYITFFFAFFCFVINVFAESNGTYSHGISLYGDLNYDKSFKHFDYVNPSAPKGGKIKLMGHGSFDSLNPYLLKGKSPVNTEGFHVYGVSELNETLLVGTGQYAPSGDETQSAYGLIAKGIETPKDRSWVKFHINEKARFHDGSAIRAEDVAFSFYILVDQGHPYYKMLYQEVSNIEIISPLIIKFSFSGQDTSALPLRLGELPVMSKKFWEGKSFKKSSNIVILNSGPYKIKNYDMGHSITFERVKDYWGKDLPIYQGRYNFDELRFDFYKDLTVALEAFKSGAYDLHIEYISKNWKNAYQFKALTEGKVIKEEIKHQQASGTQAYFLNTRRDKFKARDVRKAISLLFDFNWLNKHIFYNAYKPSLSYYPNSAFSANNLATEEEQKILSAFKGKLNPEVFTTVAPVQQFDLRKNIKKALKLFNKSGWKLKAGRLLNQQNETFKIEFLLSQASSQRVVAPFIDNLQKIGINAYSRLVDSTQYKVRLDNFDFDMMIYVLPQSNSPSHEQKDYFHSSMRDIKGSRNYSGINHTVVDHLVEKAIQSKTRKELITYLKCLDRVLLSEYYAIHHWYLDYHRIAYSTKLHHPKTPPYNLNFPGWWFKPPR